MTFSFIRPVAAGSCICTFLSSSPAASMNTSLSFVTESCIALARICTSTGKLVKLAIPAWPVSCVGSPVNLPFASSMSICTPLCGSFLRFITSMSTFALFAVVACSSLNSLVPAVTVATSGRYPSRYAVM